MVFDKLKKPVKTVKNIIDDYKENSKYKRDTYCYLTEKEEELINWESHYKKSYDLYKEKGNIEEANSIDKDRMINIYKNTPIIHQMLKEMILSSEFCCICGMELLRPEMDHVLPKNKFPQYAITPQNLVPICSDCNYSKGDGAGKNGHMVYNSYLEDGKLSQNLVDNFEINLEDGKITEKNILSNLDQQVIENYKIKDRIYLESNLVVQHIINQIKFILEETRKENIFYISKEFLEDITESLDNGKENIDNLVVKIILKNQNNISYIWNQLRIPGETKIKKLKEEFDALVKEENISNDNKHIIQIKKYLGCD